MLSKQLHVGVVGALALVGCSPFILALLQHAGSGSILESWAQIYGMQCHQLKHRSYEVFPVCARCAGLYAGMATGVFSPHSATRGRWYPHLLVGSTLLLLADVFVLSPRDTSGFALLRRSLFGFFLAYVVSSRIRSHSAWRFARAERSAGLSRRTQ